MKPIRRLAAGIVAALFCVLYVCCVAAKTTSDNEKDNHLD
jgi:hypothetical protein